MFIQKLYNLLTKFMSKRNPEADKDHFFSRPVGARQVRMDRNGDSRRVAPPTTFPLFFPQNEATQNLFFGPPRKRPSPNHT